MALLIAGAAQRLSAVDISERRAFVRRILPRAGVAAIAATIVSAASVVAPTPELISASTTPASVCPADAPVKSYDVKAINIDIPLNRFGDHDPAGKMYVLSDQLAAGARGGEVPRGLHRPP